MDCFNRQTQNSLVFVIAEWDGLSIINWGYTNGKLLTPNRHSNMTELIEENESLKRRNAYLNDIIVSLERENKRLKKNFI